MKNINDLATLIEVYARLNNMSKADCILAVREIFARMHQNTQDGSTNLWAWDIACKLDSAAKECSGLD